MSALKSLSSPDAACRRQRRTTNGEREEEFQPPLPPSMLALSLRGCSSCTATTRTRFRSFPYVRQTRPSASACHRHASRSGKGWDGLPESEESRARVKSQMTMTKGKYVLDQLLARALSRLPRKRSSQEIFRHTQRIFNLAPISFFAT